MNEWKKEKAKIYNKTKRPKRAIYFAQLRYNARRLLKGNFLTKERLRTDVALLIESIIEKG